MWSTIDNDPLRTITILEPPSKAISRLDKEINYYFIGVRRDRLGGNYKRMGLEN